MKIVTVVGARPQFIKAGIVSKQLRKVHKEILINTGQHYDYNMADVIFNDLNMPVPDYNLEVGSGTHGMQTGRMLEKIEQVLLAEKPELCIVYGDTNSTIAGALASSKLHIPVLHIEAGLRSNNFGMPEEQNRILTDHISTYLSCPTETAIKNLKNEGIEKNVFNTGDVMYDAAIYAKSVSDKHSNILSKFNLRENEFILATIHRAENTDDLSRLSEIFYSLSLIDYKIIIPLHPRTKKIIDQNSNIKFSNNIVIIEPVSYLDMIQLEGNAKYIFTDSGGVQKEAYFFKKPCLTLRDETEWIETLNYNWNNIVGANNKSILECFSKIQNIDFKNNTYKQYYGHGDAVEKILEIISN